MRKIAATYIFTLNGPPIKNGILTCDDHGTIVSAEASGDTFAETEGLEYYSGLLVPGFVNAHCHLELSFLKNLIPEKKGLGDFIGNINLLRNRNLEFMIPEMQKADRRMYASGVVAVGDISNTPASLEIKKQSRIWYYTFAETFGFHPSRAERAFRMAVELVELFRQQGLQAGVTPHAPYSVSAELFGLIASRIQTEGSILSVHNQESPASEQFFADGTGPIREHLEQNLKLDVSHWKPGGKGSLETLLSYLPRENRLLLVHNTLFGKQDVTLLKKYRSADDTWFVLCPRSNLYIEDMLPPAGLLREEGMNICIGTDSLASSKSLSVLDELIVLQQNFPDLELGEILSWSCLNGAKALGADSWAGTFEPGKKPGVNLITGIDFRHMKLTSGSRVRRLV